MADVASRPHSFLARGVFKGPTSDQVPGVGVGDRLCRLGEAQSVAGVEGAKPALNRELGAPTETTETTRLPLPPQPFASKGTAGSGSCDHCTHSHVTMVAQPPSPRLILNRTSLLLPAEKAMVPHSSTRAWELPWTEEPGRLQAMGSRSIGHN